MLEDLNRAVDHPGIQFAAADDCLSLVRAVDHPHLRLMLDLHHAQIGEGNLNELCRRALPYIGEIQVADVPGRCEPGTGEISYPAVALALAAMGYSGTVGLERGPAATRRWPWSSSAGPSPSADLQPDAAGRLSAERRPSDVATTKPSPSSWPSSRSSSSMFTDRSGSLSDSAYRNALYQPVSCPRPTAMKSQDGRSRSPPGQMAGVHFGAPRASRGSVPRPG